MFENLEMILRDGRQLYKDGGQGSSTESYTLNLSQNLIASGTNIYSALTLIIYTVELGNNDNSHSFLKVSL